MTRTTPHLRRLIGLCLLAASFALTQAVAMPAASEGQGRQLEPPTLLWKSYPLEQRPSPTEQADAQIRKRQVPRQTPTHQADFLTPALVGSFILLLAAAAIVLKRRSMSIRRGKARRTPDRGQMPGRAPQPPAPQSAADLLQALQPKSPSPPKPGPTPEVAAIRLEEAHPGGTSESVEQQPVRPWQLQEADGPCVEEGETEAGASLERQLGLELWTHIADVNLVPVPGPSPQTYEGARAAWYEDRVEQSREVQIKTAPPD